jgi:chaperonin cofactor prefoldin
MEILAAISAGELIDKITILEIKLKYIEDTEKLINIRIEYDALTETLIHNIEPSYELDYLGSELKRVNEKLWKIEDDIRECELNKNFGNIFIALARTVYLTNDERCDLKKQINKLLGSLIVEEKSYSDYN